MKIQDFFLLLKVVFWCLNYYFHSFYTFPYLSGLSTSGISKMSYLMFAFDCGLFICFICLAVLATQTSSFWFFSTMLFPIVFCFLFFSFSLFAPLWPILQCLSSVCLLFIPQTSVCDSIYRHANQMLPNLRAHSGSWIKHNCQTAARNTINYPHFAGSLGLNAR